MSQPRTGGARDAGALAVGTAVNGVMAYVFFALVTRVLGAAEAAPVAVLWTYWGGATAVITFPVQHWIIRTLQAGDEDEVAGALRRLLPALGLVSAAVSVATWSVGERLFQQPGWTFPLLAGALTLGTLFAGVVRGGLSGRGRFRATAGVIAAENTVRVLALAGVLGLGAGPAAAGAVLVVGSFVGLVLPGGWRFRGRAVGATAPAAFLGSVAAGSLIAQLVLVGGPAALALLAAPAQRVTSLFVTLALFRAPYLLAVGLANQATAAFTVALTTWEPSRLRRSLQRGAVVTVLAAGLAAAAAALVGPGLVALVFGQEARPGAVVAAVVAAASVVAVGNLGLALVEIAGGSGRELTRSWLAAAAVVAAVILLAPGSPTSRVVWAVLAGEITAFSWLAVTSRANRRPTEAAAG